MGAGRKRLCARTHGGRGIELTLRKGLAASLKGPGSSRVEVLDREPRYFERGVKEAVYIRAYQPSLNKDGGGGGAYKLPKVYDPLIDRHVIKVKTGQSADESCRVDS